MTTELFAGPAGVQAQGGHEAPEPPDERPEGEPSPPAAADPEAPAAPPGEIIDDPGPENPAAPAAD